MYTQPHHWRSGSYASVRPGYFTKVTTFKIVCYALAALYVGLFVLACLLEWIIPDRVLCDSSNVPALLQELQQLTYTNPSYQYDPCQHLRLPWLLFLTRIECSFGRRLLASVLLGGIVGWERREADRPAGIRTMSLVSLGACLFSINSAFAFIDGPMGWDSSRVAAAIPSGVGFLGAGLIFKSAEKDQKSGDTTHVVHGLTTAASLWISAAIGVACAGQLYFAASFSIAVILLLLRFGPRQINPDDESSDEDFDSEENNQERDESVTDPEMQPLRRPSAKKSHSIRARKQASLGGIL